MDKTCDFGTAGNPLGVPALQFKSRAWAAGGSRTAPTFYLPVLGCSRLPSTVYRLQYTTFQSVRRVTGIGRLSSAR